MARLYIYKLDENSDLDRSGTFAIELRADDFHYIIKTVHNFVDEDDAFVAGYLTATYFYIKENPNTKMKDWCYKGWRFVFDG
jgi:hypothetical protein